MDFDKLTFRSGLVLPTIQPVRECSHPPCPQHLLQLHEDQTTHRCCCQFGPSVMTLTPQTFFDYLLLENFCDRNVSQPLTTPIKEILILTRIQEKKSCLSWTFRKGHVDGLLYIVTIVHQLTGTKNAALFLDFNFRFSKWQKMM